MPLPNDYASQSCSMVRALEIVGERWTLLIIRDACSASAATAISSSTSASHVRC